MYLMLWNKAEQQNYPGLESGGQVGPYSLFVVVFFRGPTVGSSILVFFVCGFRWPKPGKIGSRLSQPAQRWFCFSVFFSVATVARETDLQSVAPEPLAAISTRNRLKMIGKAYELEDPQAKQGG